MELKDIQYGDSVIVKMKNCLPFIGSNTGDIGVQQVKFEDGSTELGFFDNQMGIYIKLSDCEKIPKEFMDHDKSDWLYLLRYGKTRKQIEQ